MPRVMLTDSAPKIHKQHLYFAAVVRIDGAGRIEHREPMARGETGARPHLRLEARGQRDRDAGRHHERAAPGAMVSGASAGTAANRSRPAASAL